MKTAAAIIAALCLVHVAHAAVKPEICPEQATTQCQAVAGLEIVVSKGKCRGFVKAKCKAWTKSQSTYKEAIKEWWSDPSKLCDKGSVEAAAEAAAEAQAEVWTSALVDVKCTTPEGNKACGWSFTNGAAHASSHAEAMAIAIADASVELDNEHAEEEVEEGEDPKPNPGDSADAVCYTDVRATAAALVQVAAEAGAKACNDDANFGKVFSAQYVQGAKTIIAKAFAKATASACAVRAQKESADGDVLKELSDLAAESECFGIGEVKSKTKKQGLGILCEAFQLARCDGPGGELCCDKGKRVCSVGKNVCGKAKSCRGVWRKTGKTVSGALIYRPPGRNAKKCFCDPNAE